MHAVEYADGYGACAVFEVAAVCEFFPGYLAHGMGYDSKDSGDCV